MGIRLQVTGQHKFWEILLIKGSHGDNIFRRLRLFFKADQHPKIISTSPMGSRRRNTNKDLPITGPGSKLDYGSILYMSACKTPSNLLTHQTTALNMFRAL
ncbi:hypothetical protein JTB14_019516 [Gonioctena quinquepunctata]|nr:hypothetical protein JTB14_019516 [Gonioctena quinquepunctata]